MPPDLATRRPAEIRQALIDALEAARKDQRRFTLLIYLATPLLLMLLLVGLAFLAGMLALHLGLLKDFSSAFRWASDALFALLFLAFIVHPRGMRNVRGPAMLWLRGATLCFALLLLFSLFNPLRHGIPGLFWFILYGLGMAMVVMLSASYEPSERISPGGMTGISRDEATQKAVGTAVGAEVVLGCLAAGPLFLFGAWADILRMRWLEHRFSSGELETAIHLLLAMGRLDHDETEKILKACRRNSADRILKGLDYIGWIETGESLLKLTPDGKKIVGAEWHGNAAR
jgi:hypothetical protein